MITDDLLEQSRMAEPFRESLLRFLDSGRASERLAFDYHCPPVKVARVLTRALKEYPHLPIESIEVQGESGCEYFRGELVLRTARDERVVEFRWDCKWRAEQMGWRDYFGFPDQARAAREFGWDCFRDWVEVRVAARLEVPVFEEMEDPEAGAVPA
ncbi:MAG TPA: hypothetical protein VFX98_20030 [Longimicrobiaceae bacterium]|nr:hypothetical protein [Longimicrobiaceae bacterium]